MYGRQINDRQGRHKHPLFSYLASLTDTGEWPLDLNQVCAPKYDKIRVRRLGHPRGRHEAGRRRPGILDHRPRTWVAAMILPQHTQRWIFLIPSQHSQESNRRGLKIPTLPPYRSRIPRIRWEVSPCNMPQPVNHLQAPHTQTLECRFVRQPERLRYQAIRPM